MKWTVENIMVPHLDLYWIACPTPREILADKNSQMSLLQNTATTLGYVSLSLLPPLYFLILLSLSPSPSISLEQETPF